MSLSMDQHPSITLYESFVPDPGSLFQDMADTTTWDERLRARLTASFGVPYNYSGITYPEVPLTPTLDSLCRAIEARVGFRPNNCLANYYRTGESMMGFHSDSIADLAPGTGVAIVSLGTPRTLRFRKIGDRSLLHDVPLPTGSLLYMLPEVQLEWKHGVPELPGAGARISLTFRKAQPAERWDAP